MGAHHPREEEQEEGGPSGKRADRASLWFVSQFQHVFFLCSFKLASQFSSCSVCSMTSTSFWQDGQAEISIQKARDLALLKPNARIFKPRQFRGIVRVLDESRQEAGRVTKLRNILVVD